METQENSTEESETTLLFIDTLSHGSQSFSSDEVIFKQPVILQLIRVVKSDSNPHPTLKHLQSQSQSTPAKMFEIFGKNLDVPTDRFEVILDSTTINENPELDSLVPIVKRFKTDHLIFRGEFDKLTIAIYGQLLAAEEVSMMLNKQFDMPQQQELPVKKEDDATPMLSPEEEAMLADAFKEHCVLQPHESEVRPEEMTDVEKSHDPAFVDPTKGETLEQLIAKVEAQARTILDVYACSVTSPVPSNFCVSYQNLVIAVKQLSEGLSLRPKQPIVSTSATQTDLPAVLSEICLKGLKGEINGFTEAELAMRLCRLLSVSSARVHELVSKGIMQSFADVLLQCRSTAVRMNVLKTVRALVGEEEALEAMQKQKLVIVNKPEEVIPDEKKREGRSKPKEKDPHEKDKEREKSKKSSKDKKKHKHDKDKSYQAPNSTPLNREDKSKKHSKKHGKSHHKRSQSRSESATSERSEGDKKKKVVANSVGEIIEGNYDISTLYQLVLALIMARQSSTVVRMVRDIIARTEFVEKLRTVRGLDLSPEARPMVAYSLDDLYTSLASFVPDSDVTVGLARLFTNYKLLNGRYNDDEENGVYVVHSAARLLRWILTAKGGMTLLEGCPEAVSVLGKLRSADTTGKREYHLVALKDLAGYVGLDHFELCTMMKSIGRIDREELMRRFRVQRPGKEILAGWARAHLVFSGNVTAPVTHLLTEQLADSFFWRAYMKRTIQGLARGKVEVETLAQVCEAVGESEIAAEAAADILWEWPDFAGLLQGIQQRSVDLFLILLNILLTLIKKQEAEKDKFIVHVESILQAIKETRVKLESGECQSPNSAELKDTVETLITWLEAYTVIKPAQFFDTVKSLWAALPTVASLNTPAQDTSAPNFLKHYFGVASAVPSNLQPYFLGAVGRPASSLVFFTNAYRYLNYLMDANTPELQEQVLDSGLLSHIKHMLLGLSHCFQLWHSPSCTELPCGGSGSAPSDLSSQLVTDDYFELTLQVLQLFRKILPRLISSAHAYQDPTLLASLINIVPHAAKAAMTVVSAKSGRIYMRVCGEILGVFSAWLKQAGFLESLFLPKVIELLADLPEKRFAAFYLLTFACQQLSVREPGGLEAIQAAILAENPFDVKSATSSEEKKEETKKDGPAESDESMDESAPFLLLMKKQGTTLGYVLNKLYDSHDLAFVTCGLSMLKSMANILPHTFAAQLAEELSNSIASYVSLASRANEPDFGTPTARNTTKWMAGLTKRLSVIRELIPTTAKYAILKSSLPDGVVTILKSMSGEASVPKGLGSDELERQIVECIQLMCTAQDDILIGRGELQYAVYELLPSVALQQKMLSCLSQHSTIDPPTFNALSNGTQKAPVLILDYLRMMLTFTGNVVGRSLMLFGEHFATMPTSPKMTVCFKELIDQCHELLKLSVPVEQLSPIISTVMDIALALSNSFDQSGLHPTRMDPAKIPSAIINGTTFMLMEGDTNGMGRLQEKLKEFLDLPEISTKWNVVENLLLRAGQKDAAPEPASEILKGRPLDAIYKSYQDKAEQTLQGKLYALLKSRGTKKAEALYEMKNACKRMRGLAHNSLVADVFAMAFFERFQDDWALERLLALDQLIVLQLSDVRASIGQVDPRIEHEVQTHSEPEQLQLEHANLFLSVQVMKRKQKEEIERRKKVRIRPVMAANKLASFSVGSSMSGPRKTPTPGPPSRNISTHVDDYENIQKGSKNPFPQPYMKEKKQPATPTSANVSGNSFMQPGTPTERGGNVEKEPMSAKTYMKASSSGMQPSGSSYPASMSSPVGPSGPQPMAPKPSPMGMYGTSAPEEGKDTKIQSLLDLLNCLSKTEQQQSSSRQYPQQSSRPYPMSMDPSRRPGPYSPSGAGQIPTEHMSPRNIQDLLARIAQGGTGLEPNPEMRHMAPRPMMQGMSPSPRGGHGMMSPTGGLQPLTEQEKEVFREVQSLKQLHPNDPRTQERIRKLLEQYPRVIPHLKNLVKKP